MTERGLYLDLRRMMDNALERAMKVGKSMEDAVYICDRSHRMHTVCSTLEALGYLAERHQMGERIHQSAWIFTTPGSELFEELHAQYRRSYR